MLDNVKVLFTDNHAVKTIINSDFLTKCYLTIKEQKINLAMNINIKLLYTSCNEDFQKVNKKSFLSDSRPTMLFTCLITRIGIQSFLKPDIETYGIAMQTYGIHFKNLAFCSYSLKNFSKILKCILFNLCITKFKTKRKLFLNSLLSTTSQLAS